MFFWRFNRGKSAGKNLFLSKGIDLRTCGMNPLSAKMNRGALIVFEGCDKSGKSTQSSLLVDSLAAKQVPVKHMVFPDRTTSSGVLIGAYLTNKEDMPDESIHLLFAINRWEVQHKMKKLLASGTTLVVDRYSYSGVAYSAAKGLSLDWCKAPERGLIRPDLVFYLKTEVDTLLRRGDFGKERYENEKFQEKVGQVFEKMYEAERKYWTEIDAGQSTGSIHEQILTGSLKVIDDVKGTEINILWK